MNVNSFTKEIEYGVGRVKTSLILESEFSKEIRIVLKKDQLMKEHKTAFPIVVHVLSGQINFGLAGEQHLLGAGDIIALEGNVPHDLLATEDSIVRLTLSKLDSADRAAGVA